MASALVLATGRTGTPVLALRRHDFSGSDVSTLLQIDGAMARELDLRGAVAWSQDASGNGGRPGIVLIPSDDEDSASVQVRADLADPTTAVASFTIAMALAIEACPRGSLLSIHWIVPPTP